MRRARRRKSEASRLRIAVVSGLTLIVLGGFLWAGLDAPNRIPGRSYYTVTARLADAANLTPHTQVRMSGKLVGQVLHARYENGRPTVDLQLEESLRPLRADASVRVRPRSAVGSPYVELVRGTSPRPLADGAAIEPQRSSAAVPVDAVLSAFDARTRARTRGLIEELGVGTADRAAAIGELTARLPALERDARSALAPLRADSAALRRLVPAAASVFDATAPLAEQIATGWRPGADVLDALDRRRALHAALDIAPPALRALRAGLARTDPLLASLDRFAQRALPLLRRAPATLRETGRMLASGTTHVGRLRPTVARARAAVRPTLGLLDATVDVLPRIDTAIGAGALRPLVDELAPRRCDMLLLTDNWASMMENGNAHGNVLRLEVATAGVNSLTGLQVPDLNNPGMRKNPYPEPCETVRDPRKVSR